MFWTSIARHPTQHAQRQGAWFFAVQTSRGSPTPAMLDIGKFTRSEGKREKMIEKTGAVRRKRTGDLAQKNPQKDMPSSAKSKGGTRTYPQTRTVSVGTDQGKAISRLELGSHSEGNQC